MRRLPILLAFLLATPAAAQQPAIPEWRQAREEQVLLRLNAIEPGVLRLRAGVPVRLEFYNETRTSLSVSLDDLLSNADVRQGDGEGIRHRRLRVDPGDTRAIELVPRPGRYRIHSGNLIRRFIGMSALVIVEDNPRR